MNSPTDTLEHIAVAPKALLHLSLEKAFSSIVLPRLREAHGNDKYLKARLSTATIWHADVDAGAKLGNLLLSPHTDDGHHYTNALIDDGASFNALCQEVFEPTQLHLGRLWDDQRCDEFQLTMALSRLQTEIRRASAFVPDTHIASFQNSVLLCTQPHEPHSAGLCMSTELFSRRGWDVDCLFPADDDALNQLVQSRWIDVLKVSLSGSLRRDNRLSDLRTTIDLARASSLNPSLIIMVDGRTFVERPKLHLAVHADATSVSALGAVSLAERTLAISRSVSALCQVSVG